MAIVMAGICHRLLLVETDTARCDVWCELLDRRHVPMTVIRPGGGGQHPAPVPPEWMQ